MSIGDEIRRLRNERDWTYSELARRSGVNSATLRSIETGKSKNPTTGNLIRIARAFGKRPEELYEAAGYVKETRAIYTRHETPEEILERYRVTMPASVPVYEELSLHASSPVDAIDYIPMTREQARGRKLEAYIVHGNCLTPVIEDTDIVVIDRDGQIDSGDIVACLVAGELHLARLKKIADEVYLENNHGRWKLEEAALAAPVIEVRRRLK